MNLKRAVLNLIFLLLITPVQAKDNIMQPENIVHNPIDSSHIIQVIFGLLIVLVLIALSAYFLRRFGKSRQDDDNSTKSCRK